MHDIAIRVDQLTKQYQIGRRHEGQRFGYRSLRDVLTNTVAAPLRWAAARRRGQRGPAQATQNFLALDQVSFEIKRGEVVGIIGRNGAGKSTLLKILSRITEPTGGEVALHGRVGSLLEVGTGFHPELTGRENIFLNGAILGMKRIEITRQFDAIVAFAEIEKFLDTPVKHYSSGMYMRLAFAVAAHLEPEILLIDEVLAVGDQNFQKKCLGKMKDVAQSGRTVLLVSHDMAAIQRLCQQTIFLAGGKTTGSIAVAAGIQRYMGEAAPNRRLFTNSPVVAAEIQQNDSTLTLCVDYALPDLPYSPCLGFAINDLHGRPICGANPFSCGITPPTLAQKTGQIRVTIQAPLLINGTYSVSLWFGDGKEDFFQQADCLQFEVTNMASIHQLPLAAHGPVYPHCEWQFL